MNKKNDETENLKKKIEELEKQVAELSKKASERDEYYDKYLRTLAEYDNARKRMEKEINGFVKFANENIINEFFPILDSFDSAISSMEKIEAQSPFLEGLKMLDKEFHKVLEDNGLSVIEAVGKKFDPIQHEAVMKVTTDKFEENVVAEEVRKGYMLNGKVLRPAMVKVATKENLEEKKEDGEKEIK